MNKIRPSYIFHPSLTKSELMHKFQVPLLISYVVLTSFISIFIRYLTFYFDNFTINFYRFFIGSLLLWSISYFFFKSDLKKILKSYYHLPKIIFLAGILALSEFFHVKGLSYTSATVGTLMGILGILIGISLAGLIFRDEKETIKDKYFIVGFILAVFGVIGLSISKGDATIKYSLGIYYLLVGTILGGCEGLLVKRLVVIFNPLCLASLVSTFASIFFFLQALLWGDLVKIVKVSLFTNAILFGSGIYGLLVGLVLRSLYIKFFGVSRTTAVRLSAPIFTAIFAYLFLKEFLNPLQMIFAAILIGGCFLTSKKKSTKE